MRKLRVVSGLLLSVFLIASASGYPLLAHWDFAGAAGGTTATDLVSGRVATVMGGATLNGSGGVELAGGTSGQYIDLGASFGEIIGSLMDYRIEITFDWDGPGDGSYQKLWTFSQDGTSTYAIGTFVSTNPAYFRYQHRYAAHDEQTNASTPDLTTGTFTFALEYDSTYAGKEFGVSRLFLDGVQESYHTSACDQGLNLLGNTNRNYLGKSPYDSGAYFDGTISDFKVYGVPEPATIALLGLGGLVLRRRK